MYTIIGADGKEYGPVPADKVRDWIAAGRANADTRIKAVDSTTWTTIGALPEFAGGAPAAAGAEPPAVATSSPPEPLAGDAKTIADDLIARAAPLDVFGCLGRAFDFWKLNLLPLTGVTFVVLVVLMIASAIPIIGSLVSLVMTGVFYGGLYYYYLGRMRGEPREFGDAFAGFSKAFGPLALANLILVGLSLALVCIFLVPWVIALIFSARGGGAPNPAYLIGLLVCMLPLIYVSVAWTFAFALVIDRGLSPWTALEVSRRVATHQWFRVFFVMLLGTIIGSLGMVALFVGVFFTLPIFFAAILFAYEDLCNPPPAATPTT